MANPQIPNRLLQVDDITRAEHYYVGEEDVCYHLWEYVRGGRVQEYSTNQLILNLQIPLSERVNKPYRWRYKSPAIQYAANALSHVVPQDFSITARGFQFRLQKRVVLHRMTRD